MNVSTHILCYCVAVGPEVKVEGPTEGIKVKVTKIPHGQRAKVMASALGNKHTEALEQSVKQELEKAGFGNGG